MVRYDKSTAERGRRYVRDRRSAGGGGGRGRAPVAVGGGLGAIILAVLAALLGGGALGGDGGSGFAIDATSLDGGAVPSGGGTEVVATDSEIEYLSFLMEDIQATWDEYFDRAGLNYEPTILNVFTGSVTTGCGRATSAVGPFYCPAPGDNQVYIDLDFYDELSTRFGAPGDFAQAYVIAHEVGHHLQSILGISEAVRNAQAQDPANANEYSIRQELQADCFAGVWAHSAAGRLTEETGRPILEPGDIEEGLAAAAAVGDDRIQAQAGMEVNQETWTHGSSQQRIRWFTIGFESGDPERCDTFAATDL